VKIDRKTVSVLSSQQNGFTNNQLPYNALTVAAGSIDNRMETLGLTVTKGQYKVKLGGPVLQDAASGYECIAPKVDVSLNYSPVLIYVGNEFAPGSCAGDTRARAAPPESLHGQSGARGESGDAMR
jgi:hypothetical protein